MTVPSGQRPPRAYEMAVEFDVTRRIGWSDEDLGSHIDEVFDRLHQAAGLAALEADADLDTGRTLVRMRYSHDASDDPDPERLGRTTLGIAIRAAGGQHRGLLPFAEEAAIRPERNQWSGLRTPSWKVRQVTIDEVPGDG